MLLVATGIYDSSQRMSSKEVVAAAKQYLLPLVLPAMSYVSVVCSESQATCCAMALREEGWPVRLITEDDVFGPVEHCYSESGCSDVVDSAMQLIDEKLRSSMMLQKAKRQVYEKLS